ncbi:MAG: hypothetical protein HY812_07005 [Planctomycetes bacterium]|nr:hypothetical protein [Planctomycetota bacterium]
MTRPALLLLALALACCSAPPLDPDDPTILRRPFTAQQIRDEMVPGFTVKLLRRTAGARDRFELWRVVEADAESVVIESCPLDAGGAPAGQASREASTWVELRNHAAFPAERASLSEETLETPLGALDCWLYRVADSETGAVREFHFAKALPGPPVRYATLKDGLPLEVVTQVERRRPAASAR